MDYNKKVARRLYSPTFYINTDVKFVYQISVSDKLHRPRSGAPKNSELICDADGKEYS